MPYDKPYEHKPGRGSIFPNDRKRTDNDPDFNGSAKVECPCCGEQYDVWVSAWPGETKHSGKEVISLSIRPKQGQEKKGDEVEQPAPRDLFGTRPKQQEATPQRGHNSTGDPDDDIPF